MAELLAGTLAQSPLRTIVIAALFCLIIQIVPSFRKHNALCILAIGAAAAIYGRLFSGFIIVQAVCYGLTVWLLKLPANEIQSKRRRWRLAIALLIALSVMFVIGREMEWSDRYLQVAGLPIVWFDLNMLVFLRLITLLWEAGSGAVRSLPLQQFVVWSFTPLMISLPIVRYSHFSRFFQGAIVVERRHFRTYAWWLATAVAMSKFVIGIALSVCALMIARYWPDGTLWTKAATALAIGPWAFYLTTAGYCHLMECFGLICGWTLPSNFNRPFFRQNIADFWSNWNMTATSVFRDYLFYNRWGLRAHNIYVNTVIVFVAVGLWHMTNWYWFLFGVLHGLVFCIYLAYRRLSSSHQVFAYIGKSRWFSVGSALVTYVAVCACWYLPSKIIQFANQGTALSALIGR